MQDLYDLIDTGSMYSMAEVLLVLWSLHVHNRCYFCSQPQVVTAVDDLKINPHSESLKEKLAQLVFDVEFYWQRLDCLSAARLRNTLTNDLLKDYLVKQKMRSLQYLVQATTEEVVHEQYTKKMRSELSLRNIVLEEAALVWRAPDLKSSPTSE